MTPTAIALPEPLPSDSEAVVTALESAEIFRSRGDVSETVRWLQRAAELASDAGQDARALAMAQAAAELSRSGMNGDGASADGAGERGLPSERSARVNDIMAELFDEPLAPPIAPKPTAAKRANSVTEPAAPASRRGPPPLPPDPRPPTLAPHTWADELATNKTSSNAFLARPSEPPPTERTPPPSHIDRAAFEVAAPRRLSDAPRQTEIWSPDAILANEDRERRTLSAADAATRPHSDALEPAPATTTNEILPPAPDSALNAMRQPSLSSLDVDWDTVDSSEMLDAEDEPPAMLDAKDESPAPLVSTPREAAPNAAEAAAATVNDAPALAPEPETPTAVSLTPLPTQLAELARRGALHVNLWPTTEADVFVMSAIPDPTPPSEDALEGFVIFSEPGAEL